MEEVIGYSTAVVIIDHFKDKKKIKLLGAAFILGFYINLVCLQKLNNKGVY
jgi:hypothetical protein